MYGTPRHSACVSQQALSCIALAIATLSLCVPRAAVAACKLLKIGEVEASMRQVPVAAASINGHAAQLIIDTGSPASLLWRSAIAPLGLRRIGKDGEVMNGVGGRDVTELVQARDFGFAGASVSDINFEAAGSKNSTLEVGPNTVVGILGEDFLAQMDVEFDLAAQRIRLFRPQGCNGDQVVYWAQAYFRIDLASPPPNSRWLEGHVSLNGHDAIALFDSGAARSTVTSSVAARSGMEPETDPQASQHLSGIGPKTVASGVARFATLTIGQETIQHPRLGIADVFANDREVTLGSYIKRAGFSEPDLVIGADFLHAHRVYIARSQGKIYFTYGGGPIFEPAAAADGAATPQQ
jgi:hypothetical protein